MLMIVLVLASLPVLATTVSEDNIERVEAAMVYLCKLAPRHPVHRRPKWRSEIAGHIVDAARHYRLDPLLITTILYCESAFRSHVVGSSRGERGLGQQHGAAAMGCNLSTECGQIYCTARWLAYSRNQCDGSASQMISMYASGQTCQPEMGGRLHSLVRRRMRIYRDLKTLHTH